MTTAYINDDEPGLWIVIDHDNPEENCSYPITEDEIEPILEACKEYLKIHQKE